MASVRGMDEALVYELEHTVEARLTLHCVRVAVDARAIRFLDRNLRGAEGPAGRTAEERIAQLHHATAALRELREVWLAAGLALQVGLRVAQARKELTAWLEAGQAGGKPGGGGAGQAVIATLVTAAPAELFTPAPSISVEHVRLVLEALGNLQAAQLVGFATVVGGLPGVDLDDLPQAFREPPLLREEEAMPDMVFCPQCATPYPSVHESCPTCGLRLAA